MKILHCSDMHLGYLQYGMSQRVLDFASVLPQIVRIADEEKVDAVIDTGDTFDSPEPDPFSVAAYREFADQLHLRGIPLLTIDGNHNRHEGARKVEAGMSWAQAVSANVVRAVSHYGNSPLVYNVGSRDHKEATKFIMCDWMPSDQIRNFLAQLRETYPNTRADILMLHQSCEGFMPQIHQTEVMLKDLEGVARIVAIGDLHICKTMTLPDGTIVTSAGPTELNSFGEEKEKSVNILEITPQYAAVLAKRPLKTRTALKFPLVSTESEASFIYGQIIDYHPPHDGGPLIHIDYIPEAQNWVQKLRAQLLDKGYRLFRAERQSVVDYEASFTAAAQSATTEMPEILAEVLKDTGLVQPSVDLWNNPDNATTILDELEARYLREEFAETPAASPAITPEPCASTESATTTTESTATSILPSPAT